MFPCVCVTANQYKDLGAGVKSRSCALPLGWGRREPMLPPVVLGSSPVGEFFGHLGQQFVGLFFFRQRLLEQLDGVIEPELRCP